MQRSSTACTSRWDRWSAVRADRDSRRPHKARQGQQAPRAGDCTTRRRPIGRTLGVNAAGAASGRGSLSSPRSRSSGWRPGIQPQVIEDLPDRCPLQNRRDDLELPGAAARAAPQVDVEHALEQRRPADVLRPGLHGLRVAADLACGAASRAASHRTPSSRTLRHHPGPPSRQAPAVARARLASDPGRATPPGAAARGQFPSSPAALRPAQP
jgi:hypothetical protein